jgi:hypothetical protein
MERQRHHPQLWGMRSATGSRWDNDHGCPERSPPTRAEREQKACEAIGGRAGEP